MCRPTRGWLVVVVSFVDILDVLGRHPLRGYHAQMVEWVAYARRAEPLELGQCSLFAVAHARCWFKDPYPFAPSLVSDYDPSVSVWMAFCS